MCYPRIALRYSMDGGEGRDFIDVKGVNFLCLDFKTEKPG